MHPSIFMNAALQVPIFIDDENVLRFATTQYNLLEAKIDENNCNFKVFKYSFLPFTNTTIAVLNSDLKTSLISVGINISVNNSNLEPEFSQYDIKQNSISALYNQPDAKVELYNNLPIKFGFVPINQAQTIPMICRKPEAIISRNERKYNFTAIDDILIDERPKRKRRLENQSDFINVPENLGKRQYIQNDALNTQYQPITPQSNQSDLQQYLNEGNMDVTQNAPIPPQYINNLQNTSQETTNLQIFEQVNNFLNTTGASNRFIFSILYPTLFPFTNKILESNYLINDLLDFYNQYNNIQNRLETFVLPMSIGDYEAIYRKLMNYRVDNSETGNYVSMLQKMNFNEFYSLQNNVDKLALNLLNVLIENGNPLVYLQTFLTNNFVEFPLVNTQQQTPPQFIPNSKEPIKDVFSTKSSENIFTPIIEVLTGPIQKDFIEFSNRLAEIMDITSNTVAINRNELKYFFILQLKRAGSIFTLDLSSKSINMDIYESPGNVNLLGVVFSLNSPIVLKRSKRRISLIQDGTPLGTNLPLATIAQIIVAYSGKLQR